MLIKLINIIRALTGKVQIRMEMCIYCLNTQNLTISHVIPECLGSHYKLKYFVCEKCNSKIGQSIEAKICKDFEFYRFIAQIEIKGNVL